MRDDKGRFLPGNPYRFDSKRARIAYQAAVDKIALKCCCGTYRAKQILWKQISGQWDGVRRPYVDRSVAKIQKRERIKSVAQEKREAVRRSR